MAAVSTIILAAGQGTRMQSSLPKVLHKIAGKSLLEHVVATASAVTDPAKIFVVYGHGGALVQETLANSNVQWVKQDAQLGTGHAVLQALPRIPEEDRVLILYGDVPLIAQTTLENLLHVSDNQLGILTANFSNPQGFGRIIRDTQQKILRIVEECDATPEERVISEINTGIYSVSAKLLKTWLPQLKPHNAQKELYLTDIVALAVKDKISVTSVSAKIPEEVQGVNDRVQLADLERYWQRKNAEKIMRQGVTLCDPNRFDCRGELIVGKDVVIDVNVILEGKVVIGSGCEIGPNVLLRDVTLGENVLVRANSVIENAVIKDRCIIGPFARIRPGTQLAEEVHVGNFVEIKNSRIHKKSKVNHLSYIGDSEVGSEVNVGAGVITCNYDGVNKHPTKIGDGAFIGSNAILIAPLTIGESAFIGAGSTITRDAPPHQLTLGRAKQRSIEGWQRPVKKETKKCVE